MRRLLNALGLTEILLFVAALLMLYTSIQTARYSKMAAEKLINAISVPGITMHDIGQ